MPIRQLADRFLLIVWEPILLSLARKTRQWQWQMNHSPLARWSSLILASCFLLGLTVIVPLLLIPPLYRGTVAMISQAPIISQALPFIGVMLFLLVMSGYVALSLIAGNLLFYILRISNGVILHPYYSVSIDQENRTIERHNIPGYYGEKRRLFACESYVAWLELIHLLELEPKLQEYQIVAHSIFYRYSRDFSQVMKKEVGWTRIFTVMHLLRNWQWKRAAQLLVQKNVVEEKLVTSYGELKQLESIFRMKAGYHLEPATPGEAVELIFEPFIEHGCAKEVPLTTIVDGEGGIG